MRGRLSLQERVVILVVAAILPLSALSVWLAYRETHSSVQLAQSQLKFAASLIAAHQDRVVESARHLLGAISAMPDLRGGDPARRCKDYFEALRGRYPAYTNIGLLNLQGQVVCHANPNVGEFAAADRSYFRDAVAQRGFVMGEELVGRASGRRSIPFALPVMEAGAVVGVVFAALDLELSAAALSQTDLPEGARVVVADRRGRVLMEYPPRPAMPAPRPLINSALLEAARSMSRGTGEGPDVQGEMRLYAFAPSQAVNNEGFLAIVSMDSRTVAAASMASLRDELAWMACVLLAGLLAAWWIGRQAILKPAKQILGAVRRLEQGSLDVRIPLADRSPRGEFARIAAAFNLMAESLQLRQRAVEAELGRSHSAYATLDQVLNSMQEGLLAVTSAGRFLMFNEAAARLFPLHASPSLPEDWPAGWGLYHLDGRTPYRAADLPMTRAARGESGQQQPLFVRNEQVPGGRLLHCSYRPMRGEGGVHGGLVVFTDVTELQRLQADQIAQFAQLRETQRRLVEAQRIGRLGNWELDLATGQLWWSDEVYELFGVRREDFTGRLENFMAHVHPQDRALVDAAREAALEGVRVMNVEYRIVKAGGGIFWMHEIAETRHGKDGKVVWIGGVVQDITWRKTAESDLDLLRSAVARLNDIVLISEAGPLEEPGPRIVFANDAFERLLGYPAQEAIGKTPRMLYGPGTNQATLTRMRQTLALGQGVREELLHYRKDGRHLWLELDIVPMAAGKGGFSHLIAVMRDITARKEAQKVLEQTDREREQFTRMLQRTAIAAQTITAGQSLEGTMQAVVDQARGVIGARQAVLSLTTGNDWSQVVTALSVDERYSAYRQMTTMPDGTGIYSLVCETNKPLRLTQEQMEGHPRWRSFGAHAKEHLPIWGLLAVPLVDPAGHNIGLIMLSDKSEGEFNERDEYVAVELAQLASTAIDNARLFEQIRELNAGLEARIAERTAELSRQELLFRTLAEQAPEVVWNTDARGENLTFLNRAWYELVGGTPQDWLGRSGASAIHPDDREQVSANWRRSRESLSNFTGVRRLRARDGSYHTMSYKGSPVLDGQGRVAFWVGIDADITEFKAIELALRSSNQELEAFSYSVSHDLRAPLGAIGGFSRALSHKLDSLEVADERASHYLARIQAGVEKMEELIDALLGLAKVVRAPLHYGEVRLGAMAREILEGLREGEPQRRVRLAVEDELLAQGDSRLLRAVMENLLGNAWKFTSKRDEAFIEVGQLDDSGIFFVRDNGVGFDMAYADKLFGAFQRLHTDAEFPGTGIGLATVRRIVGRHQGRVWAESVPGKGTAFFFTLSQSAPPVWLASGTAAS
ncbi:MAG: PAS domain S-box protein [Burkholderiales bacterium]|nr:PAS domain S-box protein [Burkholderiales bacterium]